MKEVCPVCGSTALLLVDRFSKKYRCKACDETFELAEKPVVNTVEKVIEKVIVEKPEKKKGLTPAEIYKKTIASIFELTCAHGDVESSGTGFYISADGYIITNSHVVLVRGANKKLTLCEEISAYSDNSKDYKKLSIVYIDPKNDLVLLKENTNSATPLKLATKLPEIGENVVAIGNSIGQGLNIVNGIIGDTDREFLGHPAFLFNALVAHGCSGGPVFNDKGEVCGVTVGAREEAEGMKYAIPLDTLKKFIQIAEIEKEIKINLF